MFKSLFTAQTFTERKKGIFISDNIVFDENTNKVKKVLGEPDLDIDSKWPFTLFRYMPFSRLYTDLNEETLTFISPKQWEDPFESALYYFGTQYGIKCLCFTHNSSIGEEWAWKSYKRDEQLVRIEIDFDKLVNSLFAIAQKSNYTFYITVCNYTLDRKGITKCYQSIKKTATSLGLTDFINCMSLKRKAFAYEKEIRIFAVPGNEEDEQSVKIFKSVDYTLFMQRVTLEPLPPFVDAPRKKYYAKLQEIKNAGISTYIKSLSKKVQQSHLYEMK